MPVLSNGGAIRRFGILILNLEDLRVRFHTLVCRRRGIHHRFCIVPKTTRSWQLINCVRVNFCSTLSKGLILSDRYKTTI